jgi:hypothetical protein
MAISSKNAKRLGKAALAKSNTISATIEGDYEDDRQKFLAAMQDLEITFDANNNVDVDGIKNTVTANTANIATNTDSIAALTVKLDNVANLFGITFNSDGTIATESYTGHTHDYVDSTIEDTADGTGTQTDTTKTTAGVN